MTRNNLILLALSFLAAGSVQASVRCSIREGAGCGGSSQYEIQLCSDVTLSQSFCKDLCRALRPICAVSEFDPWVDADHRKGKNGFKGPLADAANQYDENGVLAYTSQKTYTVCMSVNTGFGYRSPDPVSAPKVCPKSKVATPDSCDAGTVYLPETGTCGIQDPTCGGGDSTFTGIMGQGQIMVNVQNEHYVESGQVDPNFTQQTATAGTLPGLVDPTKNSNGTDTNAQPFRSSNISTQGSRFSKGSSSPVTGSGANLAAATASGSSSTDQAKSMVIASVGGGDGYKSGSGSGSGNTSGGEGSGIDSGSSATSGSATEGAAFGEDGKASGLTGGMTADGRLIVEDPDNYFLRSAIDVSLFKRVTTQCRKKERSLVLAP